MTLPTGTVTFLFTDIEGSTRLMQEVGERYVKAQTDHHAILRAAFQGKRGRELRTEGDSFFCVFESAVDGCEAAADAQRNFAKHEWPEGVALRVRMGLHTGEAPLVGEEYIGLDVHHAARVSSSAHGGQVVVSQTTRALVDEHLPVGLSLRDLGTHRLKDLARPERLYQLVIDGAPDRFPALRTLDSTPNNLPTQLTSFVGRQADVAEAKRLLRGTRLLTLTGPGGIGKTRLSLQLAADVVQDFRDGVYFVPLSAVQDPGLVPSVIVNTLGVAVTGNRNPLDAAIDYLRDRDVLLVLDNYEQLLPDGAAVVSDLLHAGSGLKAVISSRAVLHVYGEQELAVQPLGLPDPRAKTSPSALSQYEAVKLFIERAVAVKPDFRVTNENAPAVAGICERVDGLPLAIELAAARVKLFAPQALLGRLETSLKVLGSGARDLPSRQQTLAGAIAWSYDLLDEPHRRLFRRFSVFARGANLEQAEAVCGAGDPGASMPPNASRKAVRPPRSSTFTPARTRRWRSRRHRMSSGRIGRSGWTASSVTTTTSGRHSTGSSPAATQRARCAWAPPSGASGRCVGTSAKGGREWTRSSPCLPSRSNPMIGRERWKLVRASPTGRRTWPLLRRCTTKTSSSSGPEGTSESSRRRCTTTHFQGSSRVQTCPR